MATDEVAAPVSKAPQVALGLLLVVVAAVYARAVDNDYTYDDRHYVMAPTDAGAPNEMVAEWQGLGAYFTTFYGAGVMDSGRNLRPLTLASFALVHEMGGRAGLQHAVNVLLHLLATFLAFLLLRRVLGSGWPAVAGAAVFGLHALRSDPVISIVGRGEILTFVFGALGTLLYVRTHTLRGGARAGTLVATAVAMFAAFSSKESGLTWLAFTPLVSLVLHQHSVRREIVPFALTVFAPALVFLALWWPILAAGTFEISPVYNPLAAVDGATRFRTAVSVVGYSGLQTLLPFWLSSEYGFHVFTLAASWFAPAFLVSFVVLGAALGVGIRQFRAAPALFLATAAFFGFRFPTSNIPALVETIYGERLMYTPALALSLVVAWAVARWPRDGSPLVTRIGLCLGAVWLGLCVFTINARCHAWQDNATLFLGDAVANPRSLRLQSNAALELQTRAEATGYGEDALREWRVVIDRALAVHPEIRHPQALYNAAQFFIVSSAVHAAAGRGDAARRAREHANELLDEILTNPIRDKVTIRLAHRLLAILAGSRGDHRTEREHLQRSLDTDPGAAESYQKLVEWELQHGTAKAALGVLRQGIARMPARPELRFAALDLAWNSGDREAFADLLRDTRAAAVPRMRKRLPLYEALAHAAAGEFRAAVRSLEATLPGLRSPPPQAVLVVYPQCLKQLGRDADAKAFVDSWLARKDLPANLRAALSAFR